MSKREIVKPYKKDHPVSYTSGAYATIELLNVKPELLQQVFIHSAYLGKGELAEKCRENGVPVIFNDDAFRRVNQKENSYVLGVFEKFSGKLEHDKAHVVLVNPADMGNLGTIIRTIAGLNITNLAVITPAADVFHPKTIRASMGALFHLNIEVFENFIQYRRIYPNHDCYPFMLNGQELPKVKCNVKNPRFTLVFGNEATGLDKDYELVGRAVKIPQTSLVDSLNLSVAVGIGAFAFALKYRLV